MWAAGPAEVPVAGPAGVGPWPSRRGAVGSRLPNPAEPALMYRNILSVGGWTIISRLTGFFRDMALAALMGGGALNDAYVAAIKLPNQFRQIFGEGAFNAAYLPTYTNVLATKGAEEAGHFASQVFTLLILSQVALLGLVYLDMPLLIRLTSPGFVSQPEKFEQAVAMSRIMFPYIAFIAVFALHQGTLNANNAWGSPAFAPVAAKDRKSTRL